MGFNLAGPSPKSQKQILLNLVESQIKSDSEDLWVEFKIKNEKNYDVVYNISREKLKLFKKRLSRFPENSNKSCTSLTEYRSGGNYSAAGVEYYNFNSYTHSKIKDIVSQVVGDKVYYEDGYFTDCKFIIKTDDKSCVKYPEFPDKDSFKAVMEVVNEAVDECKIVACGSFDLEGLGKFKDIVCVKVNDDYLFYSKYVIDLILTHYPHAKTYVDLKSGKAMIVFKMNDVFVGATANYDNLVFEDLPESIKNRIITVENQ